jgi:hypothetical protein
MNENTHHLCFKGDKEAFRAMLDGAGISEKLEPKGINKFVVHLRTGAIINWWPSRGTIDVQGKPGADEDCKELLRVQPGVTSREYKGKKR